MSHVSWKTSFNTNSHAMLVSDAHVWRPYPGGDRTGAKLLALLELSCLAPRLPPMSIARLTYGRHKCIITSVPLYNLASRALIGHGRRQTEKDPLWHPEPSHLRGLLQQQTDSTVSPGSMRSTRRVASHQAPKCPRTVDHGSGDTYDGDTTPSRVQKPMALAARIPPRFTVGSSGFRRASSASEIALTASRTWSHGRFLLFPPSPSSAGRPLPCWAGRLRARPGAACILECGGNGARSRRKRGLGSRELSTASAGYRRCGTETEPSTMTLRRFMGA